VQDTFVRHASAFPGQLNDADALANGFARDAHHARWGDYRRHGPIVRLSGTPDVYGPGCLAGEQTQAILEELNYPEGQRADLTAAGIAWAKPAICWRRGTTGESQRGGRATPAP
jgi:crotonobetainyl-CoA:carnitine CoA-transferase CaiB-like acyl-CoA transferase